MLSVWFSDTYASAATKDKEVCAKSLLHTRMMVTDGVSKLSYTGLIIVDPARRVDETYYSYLLLTQKVLSAKP